MREDLIVPNENEERHASLPTDVRSRVVTEPFTPLYDRVVKEKPEMIRNLDTLKALIGEEDFERYINTLQNIRKNATTVMLITDKELHRTNIEAKFLAQIEKAFEVSFVRVVSI